MACTVDPLSEPSCQCGLNGCSVGKSRKDEIGQRARISRDFEIHQGRHS